MASVFRGSLTRIADLPEGALDVRPRPRPSWRSGDYVVAEVLPYEGDAEGFELTTGREIRPLPGSTLVGALSRRFATLESAGSYEDVEEDGRMHSMTEAGCFGRVTSRSRFAPPNMPLLYRGHVHVDGEPSNMTDWMPAPSGAPFRLPVVLIVGTSMSAGKTYAGRVAVRLLAEAGHEVVAAKLTGAGRWNDALTMGDAGAAHVFDFVDAGLPTTVCPADEYRTAIAGLLERMQATGATAAVIEAGASPLEPYNGGTLAQMLDDRIVLTVLCATDPCAVAGIREAWDRDFDLVAGPTANTEAGVQLVERLTSLPALDLMDEASHPAFLGLMERALERHEDPRPD